ncbi:MAG: hypothetical protein ACO1SV_25940 [Fimbriimonas sp.]
MKAVGLLLALATSPGQALANQEPAVERPPAAIQGTAPRTQPQVQGRIIRTANGVPARGVSAFLPADADGNRYYYSRSTAGRRGTKDFSETTIESWSDLTGRPLRARYYLESTAYVLEIKLTIRKEEIVFDETLIKAGERPKEAHVVVPIPSDTLLQLSQFHPMDLPLNKNDVVDFTLIDPVAKRSDRVRLARLADDVTELGRNVFVGVQRYKINGAETWTEIELAEDGQFRRMVNGKGFLMDADALTPRELEEVRAVLARARLPK